MESFWDWLKGVFRSGAAGEGPQAQERQGRTGTTNENVDQYADEMSTSPASQDTTSASSDSTGAEQKADAARARSEAKQRP